MSVTINHIGNRIQAFDWYLPRWPWMTLNAVIALILGFYGIRQIFRPIIWQWLKIDL